MKSWSTIHDDHWTGAAAAQTSETTAVFLPVPGLPVQMLLPDFRSQYPTTNALMKMQELLLAISVMVDRGTDTSAKRFLESVELGDFQRRVKIFGDPNYTIDLAKGDDLFVKVIELRATVKRDRKKHRKGTAEYDRLDAMQLALKLIANATSYGVLVEVIVDERATEVPCMVYHGGEVSKRVERRR